MTTAQRRIDAVIAFAVEFSDYDDAPHLKWVLDQMIRGLVGGRYVHEEDAENGGAIDIFEPSPAYDALVRTVAAWDTGQAP